jgi:hypothetical protein
MLCAPGWRTFGRLCRAFGFGPGFEGGTFLWLWSVDLTRGGEQFRDLKLGIGLGAQELFDLGVRG